MPFTRLGRVALLMLVPALPASAVPLAPGASAAPSFATPPPGTLIDDGTLAFELTSVENQGIAATGTIDWEAILEAGGLLRFEFVVTNDAQSSSDVGEFGASSYGGYAVDADVDGASAGTAEVVAIGRTSGAGDRVDFSFGTTQAGGLEPGASTKTLYVRTNAADFDILGTVRVRSGPATDTVDAAPQPVPEPGAALGGLAAWLGLLGWRRHDSNNQA